MATPTLLRTFLAAALALLAVASCPAAHPQRQGDAPTARPPEQEQPTERDQDGVRPKADEQGEPSQQATLDALEATAQQIATKEAARAEADAADDQRRVLELDAEIAQERRKFNDLASGMQVAEFERDQAATSFDLQEQITDLIRPLISKLKEITAEPRQLDALKRRLARADEQRRRVRTGAENVRRTITSLPAGSAERARAEFELRDYWNRRIAEFDSEYLVLKANVQSLEDAQKSLWERLTESLDRFVRSSGVSLVLCVTAFAAVFASMRLVTRVVLRKKAERAFSGRLLAVVLHVLTIVLAVFATILVPYARSDTLLLSIGIVFLIGAGWVILKTAPQHLEQLRLMLNVGSVREGERILIDGIPFRVETLRFYSQLHNPDLKGGRLRLPIRDLVGKRSRPTPADEPWFPCRQGDIVALDCGIVGKVTMQTPEQVTIVERRDAPKTFATAAFLEQNPKNLSLGFELRVVFGLDYSLQSRALDEVPDALRQEVQRTLEDEPDSPKPQHLRVELTATGSSSLDFGVVAEYPGEAAPHFHRLHRRMNQALVRACNQHGFTIPFPQLTVHRPA